MSGLRYGLNLNGSAECHVTEEPLKTLLLMNHQSEMQERKKRARTPGINESENSLTAEPFQALLVTSH